MRYIKLTADTFSTHFCLDRCNWGTMKSLEIKIASFCELFQNRFYFKDVRCILSSWSVRKFWNFSFHCIINMKNNYHQTIIVVNLMTYVHVKLTLFICYLLSLLLIWWHMFMLNSHYLFVIYLDYIKTCEKRVRNKRKISF